MADHMTTHGSLQTAVHQSADVVSNYQHYVHYIGTSEDTPMFREKLQEARQNVGDRLKDISAEIEHEIHDHIKDKNNVVDTKIVEEFGAVVREYRETERLEAAEEASHVPVAPQQANLPASRHWARELTGNLLQAISAQLEEDGRDRGDVGKTVEYANLAKDLAASFREFQDVKRLEAEQEAFYVPVAPQYASLLTSRSETNEVSINADQNSDPHVLLEELKGMEALLLESENSLKEIIGEGEEDKEEVRRIQEEIDEVRDSIIDCKILIKEQVHGTDDIESALQFSTVHGTWHCKKATGRRSNLPFLDCFHQICSPCFLLES